MASHETRLYHVGAAPVKRSTLSDANAQRPWQVFGELFAAMVPQAHRGLRRAIKDAVRLIDSTSVRLSIERRLGDVLGRCVRGQGTYHL
jgi:hypothetical protein